MGKINSFQPHTFYYYVDNCYKNEKFIIGTHKGHPYGGNENVGAIPCGCSKKNGTKIIFTI